MALIEPSRLQEKGLSIQKRREPTRLFSSGHTLRGRGCIQLLLPGTTLQMHMKEEHLLPLLQEALVRLQQSAPLRRFVLKIPPGLEAVRIHADGQQIIQVLTNSLINVLSHTSTEQAVTVQVVVADTVALIAVHAGGVGSVAEDQQVLWQRLAEGKGAVSQSEVDVNLGTGFYVSQMLIEQHHGQMGVQSHPQQGTTFWLTLPIETSP